MKLRAQPHSNTFSKQRRPFNHPISAKKPNPTFNPIPPSHIQPADLTYDISKILDPETITAITNAGKIVFHCVGDTGGVNGTATQDELAVQMEAQITSAGTDSPPAFFFHLGDVVYFNGEVANYQNQFYEPYQYYPAPIFAIPGNHDGYFIKSETSLEGFFENFCSAGRGPTNQSPYRYTVDQPWPYWTLETPFVTIIGLYSNIDGFLDEKNTASTPQYDWFVTQLKAADPNKCLILAVHHPPYSLDTVHGGYQDILDAIDQASAATGRRPNAVFTGHVHNYQRFTRTVDTKQYPYIIAGAGGYANTAKSMHQMQTQPNGDPLPFNFPTSIPGVVLATYNDSNPGFFRLTVDGTYLKGEYFINSFDNTPPPAAPFDTFTLNWQTQELV